MSVYEYIPYQNQDYISIGQDLPVVDPMYKSNDNDVAFNSIGDYLVYRDLQSETYNLQLLFPFRSVFTKRDISERDFTIEETDEDLHVKSKTISSLNSIEPLHTTTSATLLYTNNRIEAVIPKSQNLVYDSNLSSSLDPKLTTACGNLTGGKAEAKILSDFSGDWLRLITYDQRNCLSFGMPHLVHEEGYLVSIESRNISGSTLQFGLINQTAKHVELETHLPQDKDWNTKYFVLPPLARDGIGYNVYIINDSVGRIDTVNDIRSIKVYRIPYEYLTQLKFVNSNTDPKTFSELTTTPAARGSQLINTSPKPTTYNLQPKTVSHPNPAEYWVTFTEPTTYNLQPTTLILSQAYHPGWLAFEVRSSQSAVRSFFIRTFPYLFGERLTDHVLVNNWANGWKLREPTTYNSQPTTIYIFFWPQILEFMGLALLPLPFLFGLKRSH